MKSCLIVLLSLMTLASMANNQEQALQTNTEKTTADANYVGIYRGIMPCADCGGVITELTLQDDNTCIVKRLYIGRSEEVFENKGVYKWDQDNLEILLKLDGEQEEYNRFHYSDEGLSKLDRYGQNIYTNLKNSYMLSRYDDANQITSVYWVLTELGGKSVDASSKNIPFFILFNDGEVVGNSGCRSFVGLQNSSEKGDFRVNILSTSLRSCPEAKYEEGFMNVLDQAENYTIKNGELQLSQKNKVPLAKFRQVGFE